MQSRRLIGYHLRRIRVSKGLFQKALTVDANIDRTYVGGLERGTRNPSVDILDHLAGAQSVMTADFFTAVLDQQVLQGLPKGRRARQDDTGHWTVVIRLSNISTCIGR